MFLYAIDVRAAKSPDYIYSALLKTLKEAQKKGFGNSKIDLQITNVNHPLESESIAEYLNSLNTSKQLIVLVLINSKNYLVNLIYWNYLIMQVIFY